MSTLVQRSREAVQESCKEYKDAINIGHLTKANYILGMCIILALVYIGDCIRGQYEQH